jgi:hypothetical protein
LHTAVRPPTITFSGTIRLQEYRLKLFQRQPTEDCCGGRYSLWTLGCRRRNWLCPRPRNCNSATRSRRFDPSDDQPREASRFLSNHLYCSCSCSCSFCKHNVFVCDANCSYTALHQACAQGSADLVRILLQATQQRELSSSHVNTFAPHKALCDYYMDCTNSGSFGCVLPY